MPQRDQEGIPYLNSATEVIRDVSSGKGTTTRDEENYDTLKAIHIVLQEAIKALYTDFNAFKVPEGVAKSTAMYDLLRQIDGKQTAYDILAPILEAVESSIRTIDTKYKEG